MCTLTDDFELNLMLHQVEIHFSSKHPSTDRSKMKYELLKSRICSHVFYLVYKQSVQYLARLIRAVLPIRHGAYGLLQTL